jgi:hypothetical protein
MHSFLCKRSVVTLGLLAVALATLTPQAAEAKPRPGKGAHGFRLFARSLGAMTINRVYCGLSATGEICVDSTNSSTIGGGFWPKGTPDQYVFNSGLQVAGIIDAAAGFEWAGDTTGALFFDPSGQITHGSAVSPIYNMTNPEDLKAVSDSQASGEQLAARVPVGDASENLYYPLLRGRASASQGDVWFVSWDGNPGLNAGRKHPLGVLVEQRGLGWNFPAGNEDIIYFIYTFYNVTAASSSGVYASIRPGMREIAEAQGDQFQSSNNAAFGVHIPEGGYTINNFFAAFAMDADVAEATANFSSVNVPFALGYVYEHTFSPASGWTFDPGIFGTPFFAGSGFVGVKYLKSPVDPNTGQQVGLTLFSNTINGGAFNDPANAVQLYRYLSGNISVAAGDASCTQNPLADHICYVNVGAPDDMRFFQSSGPLTLAPGQFQSIVVAYIFAAPVAVGSCVGPGTCDLTPGDPTRTSDLAALNSPSGLNPIDSVAGYRGFAGDANGDGVAQQTEYDLPVSGSLMGKALTAQSVFDINFLLPFAPDAPDFFTLPGNGQVTVVWRASPTEATGDPFFSIASQVTITDSLGNPVPNPLYDPNYRQFDVEGYRVYRGRVDNPNELQLLAQFDYAGTFISDFAGQVNPTTGCAPELGINIFTPITDSTGAVIDSTPACPVDFDSVAPGLARTTHVDVPLVGQMTQVKLTGGRDKLATGPAIFLRVDTAMVGSGNTGAELQDNGVPFTYVDRTARNNLRYFYSVTAFDFNSFQSGPSSLESPRNTKPATPSETATNVQSEVATQISTLDRTGTPLTNSTVPTVDATNGTFSGPQPPANGGVVEVVQSLSPVIGQPGELTVTLDSLHLGVADATGCCGGPPPPQPNTYFFTATGSAGTVHFFTLVQQDGSGSMDAPTVGQGFFAVASVDQTLGQNFGGNSTFSLGTSLQDTLPGSAYEQSTSLGCNFGAAGYDPNGDCFNGGPRWFDGPSPTTNETKPNPKDNTINNGGALTGVTVISMPQAYTYFDRTWRNVDFATNGAYRAADFNVYWGTGGVIDSVVDITHNVLVPFSDTASGTWGVLNASAQNGTGSYDGRNDALTVSDFICVDPIRTLLPPDDAFWPHACPTYLLSNTAALGPVAFHTTIGGSGAELTDPATAPVAGNGFGLYLSGTTTLFQLAALPAAGTVWTLRTYTGALNGSSGSFSFTPSTRPFTAVGAGLKFSFSAQNNLLATTKEDLERVHTVPDPYYVTNQFEQTTDTKIIKFVNLPANCIIRIYSSSGVLVSLLEHHTATGGGAEDWNVRNRNNQVVASGVYFYHIEAGDARRIGRFTIVNFAE